METAYETLKDEGTRRIYDSGYIYTQQRRTHPQPAGKPPHPSRTGTSSPAPVWIPHQEILHAEAQIAALQRSKRGHRKVWMAQLLCSLIDRLEREVEELVQEIQDLLRITAEHMATQEQLNTFYGGKSAADCRFDTLGEMARWARAREEVIQARITVQDQLSSKRTELEQERRWLSEVKATRESADLQDDAQIKELQKKIQARGAREGEEREQRWGRQQGEWQQWKWQQWKWQQGEWQKQ
ncbi:hypothetical protein CJF31_00009989 [Rutstroemia sp. NJR-2017a BVV2]|nr:hypothetical protein CJF31_00009989 [Rutstroemia sp. NJR-2017a BVV2]